MARRGKQRLGFGRSIVIREFLISRQHNLCAYCLKPNPDTIDHVNPYSYSRSAGIRNLVAAHKRCNRNKGTLVMIPKLWPEFKIHEWFEWLSYCFTTSPTKYFSEGEIIDIHKYRVDKLWARKALTLNPKYERMDHK